MGNKSSTASKQAPPPPTHNPGDGIRSLESSGSDRTTNDFKRTGFWSGKKSKTINEAAFRTLNFELYMKPNKPIMIFGVATMTFITSYFAYTQATTGTERGSTPKKLSKLLSPSQMTSFWLTVTFILTVTSDQQLLSKYQPSIDYAALSNSALSQNQFQAWFRNFGEFPIVDLEMILRIFLAWIELFWWPPFEFNIFILKCSFRVPILENKEVDRQFDELYGEGAAKYMRERRVNKWEWSWTILLYTYSYYSNN